MALTQVKTTGIADDAVTEDKVANDAIGIAEMKAGTDGQIITYNASGNPTTVGPGTDGQVLTSTGAGSPPAFETLNTTPEGTAILSTGESGGTKFLREDGDGSCSWQTLPASGAALTGSTNNTVVTVTGANAIQGEGNVYIDEQGDLGLGISDITPTASSYNGATLQLHQTTSGSYGSQIKMTTASGGYGANDGFYIAHWGGNNGTYIYNKENTPIYFGTNGNERFRIENDGDVTISSGNLVVASGHGIDFSATGNSTGTMQNELFDDYEEGTFTPTLRGNNNNSSPEISGTGKYTKVGRLVHAYVDFANKDESHLPSGEYIQVHGLPFTCSEVTVAPFGMNYKIGFSTNYQYYFYIPSSGTIMWGYYNSNAGAYQPWGTDQWRVNGNIYHTNTFTYTAS